MTDPLPLKLTLSQAGQRIKGNQRRVTSEEMASGSVHCWQTIGSCTRAQPGFLWASLMSTLRSTVAISSLEAHAMLSER